jgi:two-component system LytT family response regulator
MTYPTILIDDDRLNIDFASQLLTTYCPDLNIVATATNMEDGLAAIVKLQPKILFLDIEIHDRTGFDLLRLVRAQTDMEVVMITAHERYAIQALREGVTDYLLKPLKVDELMNAVARCRTRISDSLAARSGSPVAPPRDFLSVPHKDHVELIPISDIIHLQAIGGYTEIYIDKKRKMLSSRSLKENEDILPSPQFLRVHHSHIVNTHHIQRYLRTKTGAFRMTNGDEVPISSARKRDVSERFHL